MRGPGAAPSTSVPFSQIQHEIVRAVEIRSNATLEGTTYRGAISKAFVFSSTLLQSRGRFAAEIVDETQLQPVLTSWHQHPDYVSAQTYHPTGTGKVVILTVLNQRSTGY